MNLSLLQEHFTRVNKTICNVSQVFESLAKANPNSDYFQSLQIDGQPQLMNARNSMVAMKNGLKLALQAIDQETQKTAQPALSLVNNEIKIRQNFLVSKPEKQQYWATKLAEAEAAQTAIHALILENNQLREQLHGADDT